MKVSDDVLGSFILVRCLDEAELRARAGDRVCESPHKVFFFDGPVMYYFEKQ